MSTTTTQSSATRKTGLVKFFNPNKGYGFIQPKEQEEGSDKIEDVFVHHSAIKSDGGFRSLCPDEEVEYDLIKGPKGMQATLVTGVGGGPVKGNLTKSSQSHGRQSFNHNHQYMELYGYQNYHPDYYNGISYYQLQGYNPTPSTFVYHHQYHHPPNQQPQGYTTPVPSASTHYPSNNLSPTIIHYSFPPSYHAPPTNIPYYSYPVPFPPSSPIDSQAES